MSLNYDTLNCFVKKITRNTKAHTISSNDLSVAIAAEYGIGKKRINNIRSWLIQFDLVKQDDKDAMLYKLLPKKILYKEGKIYDTVLDCE